MSIRTITTIAVAIVLGLIVVVILNSYLNGSRNAQAPQVAASGVPVVVAAQPIGRGVTLQASFLKVVSFPSNAVPIGAFTAMSQLVGGNGTERQALRNMTVGEPILPAEVSGPGGRLNLASVVEPGMQAIAIRSSDVAGVGGFVLPGDAVDVLLTRVISRGNDQPANIVTQIIAENVKVLGVDQSDNDETTKPAVAKSVTLQVTPAQAQTIALGQAAGALTLSLRHVADQMALANRATQIADLGFAAPLTRPAPPPRPAPPMGAKSDEVSLYGPGVVRVTRVTETTAYRVSGP